jgi:23S rRNA pseudouridine1911/1915/1917 synthase
MATRRVERRYLTLVRGDVASDEGLIDAPIGRSSRHPTRMAVSRSGREARTRYRVVERLAAAGATLLECSLETGRTHQIRVHLAAIGHPVIGDDRYGGNRPGLVDRPFLHAHRLAFPHPVTGAPVEVSSPLPPDLQEALDRLRATRG